MIGERLKEIRKDRGDTQATLAKKLKVSLATVKAWESERSSPSHEMLVAICKLYHVSSDYLLGLSNIDPLFFEQNKKKLSTKKIFADSFKTGPAYCPDRFPPEPRSAIPV